MDIRADSTAFISAPITADHDISTDQIEVALPVTGQDPATWWDAEVVSTTTTNGKTTVVFRVLVGPLAGVTVLTKGTSYDFISRVTDTPERPVQVHGAVRAI